MVICRVAPPNPKTQKKERKDLQVSPGCPKHTGTSQGSWELFGCYVLCIFCGCVQEVCHKLCETLSMVANVGITHPDYVLVDSSEAQGGTLGTALGVDSDRRSVAETDSAVSKSASDSRVPSQTRLSKEALSAASTTVDRSSSGFIESWAGARRKGSVEESDGSGSDRGVAKWTKMKRKVPVSVELLQPALQALTVLSNVRTDTC